MLERKKFVVISQPECRRHNFVAIDLVCSIFGSIPKVRVCKVPTNKGFPYAITL
jgi:hypothetical protein